MKHCCVCEQKSTVQTAEWAIIASNVNSISVDNSEANWEIIYSNSCSAHEYDRIAKWMITAKNEPRRWMDSQMNDHR